MEFTKSILDDIRPSLKRRKEPNLKRHHVIRGAQGSGKTLLLIKFCKMFLEYHPDLEAFIFVSEFYLLLQQQLKEYISKDCIMSGNVVVASDFPRDEADSFSLILVDEAQIHPDGKFYPQDVNFYKNISPSQNVILFSSLRHFTSDKVNNALREIGSNIDFQEHNLQGNLRSSAEISNFVGGYQRKVTMQGQDSTNLPVTPGLEVGVLGAFDPIIKVVNDESDERKEILDASQEIVNRLMEGKWSF
jgi:archaellum biogenesis ATPase FlaH